MITKIFFLSLKLIKINYNIIRCYRLLSIIVREDRATWSIGNARVLT